MKKIVSILTLAVACAFFIGCGAIMGEEVARLSINQVSTSDNNKVVKETVLDLKKDEEIAIWSDIDVEYEGDVGLRFKLEILKDGISIHKLEIDPMDKNITIGEVKTVIMGKTDWRFHGKNSSINIEEDGRYTFIGMLITSKNPTLKVNKAEVVLKK